MRARVDAVHAASSPGLPPAKSAYEPSQVGNIFTDSGSFVRNTP